MDADEQEEEVDDKADKQELLTEETNQKPGNGKMEKDYLQDET